MNLYKIFLLFPLIFFVSCTTVKTIEKTESIPEKSLYEKFIEAAEKGDTNAIVQVGISYEEGRGVDVDLEEAYKWYKSAAAKGSSEAYYRLGTFFERGYFVEKNSESAMEWYLSSAATGFHRAINKLIQYYEDNPEERLFWIRKGVEVEEPYSCYCYFLILEPQYPEKALEYLIMSKESEDSEVRGVLSIFSLNGRYAFFNQELALQYLSEAAASGHHRSQVFLGWLYEFGLLLEKSPAQAFDLYESAAKQNNIPALYNLSRFYGEGISVEKDSYLSDQFFQQIPSDLYSPSFQDLLRLADFENRTDQKIVLYRLKASSHDIDAYYHLGLLSSPQEAFQWFWMAADAGHNQAMIELARLYLESYVVEGDPVKAAAWLMVAENRSGHIDNNLSSRELLKDFSEEQKLEVSRLFTEFYYKDN
ncbi:MAG: sel1 repeat family protein [Spirochaetaceae bacterium]|nr:sel1 repeat family protein [Spirochaetaceae bacterium]